MKRELMRRGQEHGNQTCKTNSVKQHWTTDSREGRRKGSKQKKGGRDNQTRQERNEAGETE